MFICDSRHQFFRRAIVIIVLIFVNLFLFFSVVYLTNNGGQYLPSADDFSQGNLEKNTSFFVNRVKFNIGASYASINEVGINFLHSRFGISLIILLSASALYVGICVISLIKAAFNYTDSRIYALSMLIIGVFLFCGDIWLTALLLIGGDWFRSFWSNLIFAFTIYGLNRYSKYIQDEDYYIYNYSAFHRFFRGLGFLAVPMLSIILLGFGIYFSSNTIIKEITIDARNGWTSTGLSLNTGEAGDINYIDGNWAVNQDANGNYLYTDVNGRSIGYRACKLDNLWYPRSGTTPGQLLARIGTNNEIIPLGNHAIVKSANFGILYLRANDSDLCLSDNNGNIKVRVIINRINWSREINWSVFNQTIAYILKWITYGKVIIGY